MKFLYLYENDRPEHRDIRTELKTWVAKWQMFSDTLPYKFSDVLPLIDKLAFPNVYTELQLATIFPVPSCSREYCISDSQCLKMYLRDTMSQDRLSGLALFNVPIKAEKNN